MSDNHTYCTYCCPCDTCKEIRRRHRPYADRAKLERLMACMEIAEHQAVDDDLQVVKITREVWREEFLRPLQEVLGIEEVKDRYGHEALQRAIDVRI